MQGGVSRGSGLQWSRSDTFSQLCLSVAGPLLLKCNHSNLLLWFPIERISHVSVQRRLSSLLQSERGISLLTLKCFLQVSSHRFLSAPPALLTAVFRGAVLHLRSSHQLSDRSAFCCISARTAPFFRHVWLNFPTRIERVESSRLLDGMLSKTEQRC